MGAVLIASGVMVANSGLLSSQGRNALLAAAASVFSDPDALFAARSPGMRDPGALTDTKGARDHTGVPGLIPPAVPGERVLTTVRTRPPIPFVDAPPAGLIPFVDVPGPFAAPPAGDVAGVPPVLIGVPGIGGPLPGVPGGGGGGGGDIPGVPGIPEPATWAMLILGFFGIGAAMRRRNRRVAGVEG